MISHMSVEMTDSVEFDADGNVTRWLAADKEWVETRPIRQNARVDFRGILVWIKSAELARSREDLLPSVEWEFETNVVYESSVTRVFERTGKNWTARLSWSWLDAHLKLAAEIVNGSDGRWRQLEFSFWVPADHRGSLDGSLESHPWSYEMPPYGRVKSGILDRGSPLRFRSRDGRHITLHTDSADSRTHYYHRGFCLKMGSGSSQISPDNKTTLEVECSAESTRPTTTPTLAGEKNIPDLRTQQRSYQTGLMLHLQYTELPNAQLLLQRWIPLAAKLGFRFIVVELDRGFRAHPASTKSALGGDVFRILSEQGKDHDITLIPMYNLLGHQWETGVLDWQPSWQETGFSGLCPSHPAVRAFASDLIAELAGVFGSTWVHIGGDELKFPGDGKDGLVCPLCGPSPNLAAVVDYWNFLQHQAPNDITLAIWGDQLLPPHAISPGLRGHNWDGRGADYLNQLDSRIRIFDWQYSSVNPRSSLQFLGQAGHSVSLTSACGESLCNPFIHAETCRNGDVDMALHTTWTSPDPGDAPLEGVAGAALAHAGLDFDPKTTPAECKKIAMSMFNTLNK